MQWEIKNGVEKRIGRRKRDENDKKESGKEKRESEKERERR